MDGQTKMTEITGNQSGTGGECMGRQGPEGAGGVWEASWASLDRRPVPQWFDDAKFGIFIHWGIYSVPSWAPKRHEVKSTGEAYAEWYGWLMQEENRGFREFHRSMYGENFRYEDFAPMFKAELFDADRWADLIQGSGARYVALTSKHHDAFCLWPSEYSWNWNSVDIGPHRDLVGELTQAVRARGIRMGLYYSLMEWFRPLYERDPEKYALQHMLPQMKELITAYQPSLLFTDGEWAHDSSVWHSCEFLAWLFNESSLRDEVVVNDRWGADTRSRHGGYYTTEYGEVFVDTKAEEEIPKKWEECRSIGASFGYNRNEDIGDYRSAKELIALLADTVSRGGNLLLNIGPCADGTIPVVMQERLKEIGGWLAVNGEAIYGTRRWRFAKEREGIFYTSSCRSVGRIPDPGTAVRAPGNPMSDGDGKSDSSNGCCLYVIIDFIPEGTLYLEKPVAAGRLSAKLVGTGLALPVAREPVGISIDLTGVLPSALPCGHAWVLRIEGVV